MTPGDEIFRAPSRVPIRLAGITLLTLLTILVTGIAPFLYFWQSNDKTAQLRRPLARFSDYSVPAPPPTLRIGTSDQPPSTTTPPTPTSSPTPSTRAYNKETLLLLPDSMEIKNAATLAELDKAAKLRSSGNTPAAMDTLRTLETKIPDHPLLLFQLAETASALGLDPLAREYWTQLHDQGENISGDYAAYADMRLHHDEHTIDSIKLEASPFEIGPVLTKNQPLPDQESVTLSIPIELQNFQPIDPSGLEIYVYFFETLPSGQILQSESAEHGGPTVVYRWQKNPDWRTGPEVLEVEYHRPIPASDPGRKFHGYIVRTFYQGRLQDVTARPRTLFDLQLSPATEQDPDLENTAPSELGPDPSLFQKSH